MARDTAFALEAALLCVKRDAFEHEDEVRLMFHDVAPDRGVDGVFHLQLDPHFMFDEAVLDPWCRSRTALHNGLRRLQLEAPAPSASPCVADVAGPRPPTSEITVVAGEVDDHCCSLSDGRFSTATNRAHSSRPLF